jgi:hypothetical protein
MLRIAAAVAFLLLSERLSAAPATKIIGAWKADDGRGYAEVHFRADHSFTLFARMSMNSPIVAMTQMAEKFGTWEIVGERLHLDSQDYTSRKRSQIFVMFRLNKHSMTMQNIFIPSETDTYDRLHLHPCADPLFPPSGNLDKSILIGRWRSHYRTHDAEFSFEPGNYFSISAWDLGDRLKISQGTWRLSRNEVVMKTREADERIDWTIIRVGANCLVIRHGPSMT